MLLANFKGFSNYVFIDLGLKNLISDANQFSRIGIVIEAEREFGLDELVF